MSRSYNKKKYRYIANEFWNDKYIQSLEPIEKYAFLYFLTCPNFHISGIYNISLKRAAIETDLSDELLIGCLDKFALDGRIFFVSNAWIIIPRSLAHKPLNSSIMTNVLKVISELGQSVINSNGYKLWLKSISAILDASEINLNEIKAIKKLLNILQ